MFNKYEKPVKTINLLGDLEGNEIRHAFGGIQETRIALKCGDVTAIVGQDDAVFLQAAYELTKALNEKTGSGLTVPQFIANAIEKEGLDASAIRGCAARLSRNNVCYSQKAARVGSSSRLLSPA